ncbi:hypothetical protein [Pseudomonas sp. TH31]|uniref:hypothetical protein n=1 Tax=Pseudomonas sp. TH31 TaxID=2796396 RepID=UPI0019145C1F|nr:hypothetical protein [Pseudomonas sp. TH31]MBK5417709.1 hypothetical protein [Pseudomonas sp. TH31]
MTAALNIPELINMGEVMDVRNLFLKLNGYKSADLDLIYKTGMACRYAGQNFNWNERNDQVFGRKPVTFEEALFPPELPPVPKPFRSWLEVMVSLFGGLNDCEYEPRKYKMKYVTEHTYQPDWVDSLNDRLVWEGKGVIPSLQDANKYRCVARQNGVHFIFIFQCKNINCPWARPRKDGTRMTLEEWCKKEGFDFTFEGEEAEFRKTPRYLHLVKTFGKDRVSLIDQLLAK